MHKRRVAGYTGARTASVTAHLCSGPASDALGGVVLWCRTSLGVDGVESGGLVGRAFPDVRTLRTQGGTPRPSVSSNERRMKACRGIAPRSLGLDTRRRMG
jgi:hypothetical protein